MEKPTVIIANLDKEGIYLGTKETPEESLLPEHIVFGPEGCDLPPGQYRWNDEKKTFVHLGRLVAKQQPQQAVMPANVLAWSLLFQWNKDKVQGLPSQCLIWLDEYVRTIDFLGTYDGEFENAIVQEYIKVRGI